MSLAQATRSLFHNNYEHFHVREALAVVSFGHQGTNIPLDSLYCEHYIIQRVSVQARESNFRAFLKVRNIIFTNFFLIAVNTKNSKPHTKP